MDVARDPPSPSPVEGGSAAQVLDTPDSQLKRKRQPRNSACQGCAALKMKCIQTANGKCERCNRMDRDCVPAIPKPRKRRTESAVGMDGEGMSMLEFAAAASTPAAPPPKFDPPRASMSASQAEKTSLLARHDLSQPDSKSFVSLFSQGLGNITASEELLRGVDSNFVANAFAIFGQLTPHFPFVEVSPGSDVFAMVARRPVLTLAICTVASASMPDAQDRLVQAFQYALASKVFLGSERSMDVFTGLLVHLAWHHQYMLPNNIYQQLYLLAGMAADLGLYQTPLESLEPDSALERDRAFVGCYYLCCSLAATGFDKPGPLRWTDNLHICAENAAVAGRLPSDRALVSVVKLVHALDDMEDSLRQAASNSPTVAIHLVELQTKVTSQGLKALKREHSALAGTLGFSAATIHIYQRLLRISETPDYPTLIQCACAIKEYLDDILARRPSTLHQIAIVDFTNLIEVLVLMARILRPLPAAGGWEVGALTSMLQPEIALDSICSHMASAPSNDPLSPRHEAVLSRIRSVCDGIKKRVLREGAGGAPKDVFNLLGNGVLDATFWEAVSGVL